MGIIARGGSVDFSELERLRDNLQNFENERRLFIEACAKEVTARILAGAIKRTPVGNYDKKNPDGSIAKKSNKKGGTLRRGWTTDDSLKIKWVGDTYQIELINPVEYASYVEYGHRTRGGKGWVKGKFMLRLTEDEIRRVAPNLLEKRIQKKLKDLGL